MQGRVVEFEDWRYGGRGGHGTRDVRTEAPVMPATKYTMEEEGGAEEEERGGRRRKNAEFQYRDSTLQGRGM